MPPQDIEAPLGNGTTDVAFTPANRAQNAASTKAGSASSDPPPWNVWSKGADPNMPAQAYDQMRLKYFNEAVVPRLHPGDDRLASWEYFKKRTERAPTLDRAGAADNRFMQFATGVVHAVTKPLAGLESLPKIRDEGSVLRNMNKHVEEVQAELVQKARRNDIGVLPSYGGEFVGAALPLGGTEKIAGNLLSTAGIDITKWGARLVKGGVSFGIFEAATAKEGDRLTAGVKGFATGLAIDGAIGLTGKLIKRGFKQSDIDKIVTGVLNGEETPDEVTDALITQSIEHDARASKAEGRPQFIKEDPNTKGVSVLLHDAQDRAITVKVRPGMEQSAIKEILNVTRGGGAVDGIIHHPNSIEMLQRFMRASADEGADRYEGVKIIKTAEGQARSISLEDELDGKASTAVSESEIITQDTHRAVPHRSEIEGVTKQLRDSEGYPLSKGAQDFIRSDVEKLWNKDIPDERKELSAQRLAAWDLKDMIPEEWKRENPNLSEDALDHTTEIEQIMQEDISQHEPQSRFEEGLGSVFNPARASDEPLSEGDLFTRRFFSSEDAEQDLLSKVRAKKGGLQAEARLGTDTAEGARRDNELLQQAKRELPQGKPSDWLKRAQELKDQAGPQAMKDILIPESENYYLEQSEQGPRKVQLGETPLRYSLKVSNSEMHDLIPGAEAATGRPGITNEVLEHLGYSAQEGIESKPTVVYKSNPKRMTVYHEGLHVDKYHVPGMAEIIQADDNTASNSIAEGLKGERAYTKQSDAGMREEAFVHAASAIRAGNARYLEGLVKLDGTVQDVFNMVHDRAVKVIDAARAGVDSAPSRIVQRKMEDLVLRTSPTRAWDLIDQTSKLMHDWWYDPESASWKIRSLEDGTEHSFSNLPELADHIQKRNGDDWAPSATLWAEARGVRGPITPQGGSPTKEPFSVNTPPDPKWGGWGAVSGLYRPMGPWVADLHTRVNDALSKYGKRLPIFDRWKAVDEAFRDGDSWLQNNYTEAADLLDGVDNKKQYSMFDVLATDPKHWPAMGKQLGLTSKDLEKVDQIDKWLGKFRDETGILVKNYLRDELPRLRSRGYTLETVYGNLNKTKAQMSTFERMITEGKLDPKARHIGSFMDTMLREGFSKKFTDKPLKELEKLVDLKAKNGGYILGNQRYPLKNYTNYMRGIPDVTGQVMNKVVGQFLGALEGRAKVMNKHLPSYAQLPTDFGGSKTAINKMMVWSYAAGLGLRAAIPVRDFMQVFTTSLPVLGMKRFAVGMESLAKGGFSFAAEQGGLLQKRSIGELYGDIFNEIPVGASTDYITKLANKLLAPSRWGHNLGRAIAFNGEYSGALNAVRMYRSGELTLDELVHDHTSLWWNDKPVVDRIVGQMEDRGFSDHEVARNIALETLDLTLWPYRRGSQPTLLRTGAGRIFGQFGMWPLSYRDFLMRGAKKFSTSPKNALKTTALWSLANYGMVWGLNQIGADAGKWFGFSPAAVDMSPHLQFVVDLAKSPSNSQEGREARKRVLEYPIDFFPSGIELKNIESAMDSNEDMFNPDGTPTASMLKVLGFKPLKDTPDRELEEELEYQMGYSERKRRQ
jgi:hypothetical protein